MPYIVHHITDAVPAKLNICIATIAYTCMFYSEKDGCIFEDKNGSYFNLKYTVV